MGNLGRFVFQPTFEEIPQRVLRDFVTSDFLMKLSDYPANLQRGSFSPRRGCVLIGDAAGLARRSPSRADGGTGANLLVDCGYGLGKPEVGRLMVRTSYEEPEDVPGSHG